MPKIPTLERQSPGARPILMDVDRGGSGRAARAEGDVAQALGKTVVKIAELFGKEDQDAKKNRINSATNAGYTHIQNIAYETQTRESSGRGTYQYYDKGTSDESINKILDEHTFQDDDERKEAFNSIVAVRNSVRGKTIMPLAVQNAIILRTNQMEKKANALTEKIPEFGIYANPLYLPKLENGEYKIPNLSDQLQKIIDFGRGAPDGKGGFKPNYLTELEFQESKDQPFFSFLDFDKVEEKGKVRYKVSFSGDYANMTPQQMDRMKRALSHKILDKLYNHAESFISQAETQEELEKFDKKVKIPGIDGETNQQAWQEVKIKNPITNKTETLTTIGYLEQLLSANRKQLEVKIKGEKTIYDNLSTKIFALREKYNSRMDKILKGKPGEKLKRANTFYGELFQKQDRLEALDAQIKTKGRAAGFETTRDDKGATIDELSKWRKEALTIKNEIHGMVRNFNGKHSDVVNFRTAEGVYTAFKKTYADKYVNILMREVDDLYETFGGNVKPNELQRFDRKFNEYVSSLPIAHRKSIVAYKRTMEKGNLPPGYRTKATAALEHLWTNRFRRPLKVLRDEAGPDVVLFGKMKMEFWRVAKEGVKKNNAWVVRPNYQSEPQDVMKHLKTTISNREGDTPSYIDKELQNEQELAVIKVKNRYPELIKKDGFPGLYEALQAYDSNDPREFKKASRKLRSNIMAFRRLYPPKGQKQQLRYRGEIKYDQKFLGRMRKMNRKRKQFGTFNWKVFVESVNNMMIGITVLGKAQARD